MNTNLVSLVKTKAFLRVMSGSEAIFTVPLCQYDSSSLPGEPNEAHIGPGNTSQSQLKATPSAQHHLEQGSRGQESVHCAEVSQGEPGPQTEQDPLPCQALHISALLLAGQHRGQGAGCQSLSLTSILPRSPGHSSPLQRRVRICPGPCCPSCPAPAAREARSSLPSHGSAGRG